MYKWIVKFVLFVILKKSIDNFYNKYRECKQCYIKRSLNRYYENKAKLSNQKKIYYEKIEMCYIQSLN